MSIKTKIAALALAALAVTGGMASTTTQAQAKPRIGSDPPSSAPPSSAPRSPLRAPATTNGYRRCGWVARHNAYGNYIGRVRTCNF